MDQKEQEKHIQKIFIYLLESFKIFTTDLAITNQLHCKADMSGQMMLDIEMHKGLDGKLYMTARAEDLREQVEEEKDV